MTVDGAIPGGPEQVYSQGEIILILSRAAIGADARAEFMRQLSQYELERNLAQQEAERSEAIVSLAVLYERVEGEGASDDEIEGWYERLELQTGRVLGNFHGREPSTQTETLARNVSAFLYVGLTLQARGRVDTALLREAGLNEDELVEQCRGALIEAAVAHGADPSDGAQKVREQYPTPQGIPAGAVEHFWQRLIVPMATELRASLLAEGHELPELNEQGKYSDEDEEHDE